MQQTIHFETQVQVRPAIDVRATIRRKIKSINLWLDTKSEFYSRIAEFPVTRRLALHVNLVSLCLMIGAIAIEQHPIVATLSAAYAAWLVYRINKTDKKGEKNENDK
uniref:Tat pathway signal protein n=1 Tax=Prevotella sp. GTC17262 TaxID=3236797 RepID=A0AB33JKX1_9BACT